MWPEGLPRGSIVLINHVRTRSWPLLYFNWLLQHENLLSDLAKPGQVSPHDFLGHTLLEIGKPGDVLITRSQGRNSCHEGSPMEDGAL